MRLFPGIDNGTVQDLIIEACFNLLNKNIEPDNICQANLELVADALSFLVSNRDTEELLEQQDNIDRRIIIKEMIEFLPKLRRTYGVTDPVEGFLIWLSTVCQGDIENAMAGNIASTILAVSSRESRQRKEEELLEFQESEDKEKMQKLLGGIPLINCAMKVVVLDLGKVSAEIEGTLGKKLKKKLKKSNTGKIRKNKLGGDLPKIRKRELLNLKLESLVREEYLTNERYKSTDEVYILLIDCSGSMNNSIFGSPEIRRYNYAAGTIVELFKLSGDSEVIIAFFDSCVQYKTLIKNQGGKRMFWETFGYDRFNGGETNISNAILEITESPEYKKISKGKSTSLIIITDGEDNIDVDQMVEILNEKKVDLNVMLLNDAEDLMNFDIVRLTHRVKGGLFILENGKLVEQKMEDE